MKNNNKDEKIEKMKYEMLGNVFLGSLIDVTGDIDNSGQNFVMYMEYNNLKELYNNGNNKDNSKHK